MGYQLPKYIVNSSLNNQTIDYFWDDTSVDQTLDYSYATPFIKRMEHCTLRAKIALSIGVYEWVLGRFAQLHDHAIFYQIAEAAWCANADRRCLKYIELDYQKYRGPINYAQWLAYSALFPILLVSENISQPENKEDYVDPLFMYDKDEWQECLSILLALLKHILPEDKLNIFENWFNQVIQRLATLYIEKEENPFANLFGHKNNNAWLGDYVAREVLDPDYPYQPQDAISLLNHYLSQVDKNNPVLLSLAELKQKLEMP